jgi:hypothetical protein
VSSQGAGRGLTYCVDQERTVFSKSAGYDSVREIDNLEIHAAHSCNLSCESCSHYSNQGHKGIVPTDEAGRWMEAWKSRISPEVFSIVGGEPTIHPDLAGFISAAREHWPTSRLRLVTNGYFLHRHQDLPKLLRDDPNTVVILSIHHDSPRYLKLIQPSLDLLNVWKAEHGIRVGVVTSHDHWTRRYRGSGSEVEPFEDGDPRRSWEICTARGCPQLFEESIWKCAALAYLTMQNEKHHISSRWAPYLRYRPLAADCTDDELNEFFDREDEPYCGMCPATPRLFTPPLPTKGVNPRQNATTSAE